MTTTPERGESATTDWLLANGWYSENEFWLGCKAAPSLTYCIKQKAIWFTEEPERDDSFDEGDILDDVEAEQVQMLVRPTRGQVTLLVASLSPDAAASLAAKGAESEQPTTIAQWVQHAPPKLIAALQDVSLMNHLRQNRNTLFQMAGAYDGAMSDACKQLCLDNYHALDELIAALERKDAP